MDDPRAGIPLKQESRAPVLVFTLLLCLTIGFLAGRLL